MVNLVSNVELAQQYYDIAKQYKNALKYTTPEQQRDFIAEFSSMPNFADFYQRHQFVPHVPGMDCKTHLLLTLIFEHCAEKAKSLYASKLMYSADMEKHVPRTEWAIEHPPYDEEGGPNWDNIVRTLEDFADVE